MQWYSEIVVSVEPLIDQVDQYVLPMQKDTFNKNMCIQRNVLHRLDTLYPEWDIKLT